MRTHQSEFATLLHKTMCFTVPKSHVTRHLCLDDLNELPDVDDDIDRLERDYRLRPAKLAKAMLENDGARLDSVHVNICSDKTCQRIAKRFESHGWIKLEAEHEPNRLGRPALHFQITDKRAMWKMAGGGR